MRKLETGFTHPCFLIEDLSELPSLTGTTLYCDLETTSGDPKKKSISPWRDCRICGIALRSDASPAYYIPVRHNRPYEKYNLPVENVRRYMQDILRSHPIWCNQNVKYDAHALFNDWGLEYHGKYICTIHSRAKLHDSERMYTGGYSLDKLAATDLGKSIKHLENALQPYLRDSQDYGDISPLVLAPYACEDVNTCAELNEFYPHEVVENIEANATTALIEMERAGVNVVPMEIEKEEMFVDIELYKIQKEIFDQMGKYINPSSQEDMEDAMINILGLPVLQWTETDDEDNITFVPKPSFAKGVMEDYRELDDAPIWFIDRAVRFRSLKTYKGLFLESYAEKNIDGVLHPWYNQTIATGRMSCSNPNLTQCDMRAKALIVPKPGESIARADYSQIEFRIISDYIKFLEFWMNNPDADFYDGISAQAGCERKPSKVLALGSGYGMGRPKLVRSLKKIKSVRAQVQEKVQDNFWFKRMEPNEFKVALDREVEKHCGSIYDTFHKNLPSLKQTFNAAEQVAKRNGWVKTKMGRKRHLKDGKTADGKIFNSTRKAFNAACQGSAADLIKIKIFELIELLRKTPVRLVLQVHDELVFTGPTEIIEDPRFMRDVIAVMEENPLPMTIPIRARGGYSRISWKDACWGKDHPTIKHEISNPLGCRGERFSWLQSI